MRRLWVTDEAAGANGWEHLQTMLRVQREVRRDDGYVEQTGTRYFASSLDKDRLTPDQWLRVVRAHWRIENGTHGVADVAFEEDRRPWFYETTGQLIVTVLRRVMINLLALYRSVSRRGERKNAIPWRDLIEEIDTMLKAGSAAVLEGLRWPDFLMRALGPPEREPTV